jgi:hypothetical protein
MRQRGFPGEVAARAFPHVCERAAVLFERDETFRELCEDYEACAATVVRLQSCDPSEGMCREYAALLLRLERELLRYLEEHADRVER